MQGIYIWLTTSLIFALAFIAGVIGLIIISKKTHAIIEFKSSIKGRPIGLFFQDNKYCEWRVLQPEAGLVVDKDYGYFMIESTYIDKVTKNVMVPFNTNFAMSLNVKAAKLSDDLSYLLKEKSRRSGFKKSLLDGRIPESDGVDTLRTSVDFSPIKHYVSPILPHSIQSKVVNTVRMRLGAKSGGNLQNVILLIISAVGAIVLGGLVLKFVVFV
jgi:hypothetical protein